MNSTVRSKFFVIKNNSEIKNILSKRNKIITKYGIFFIDEDKENDFYKYAVLIKKYVGNAVKRNYCKRIVREFIKIRSNIFKGKNKIIFLYNYKGDVTYRELENEFLYKLKNS